MKKVLSFAVLCLGLLAVSAGASVDPTPLHLEARSASIQEAVTVLLTAVQEGREDDAYETVPHNLRSAFGSSKSFVHMLVSLYPMTATHTSVVFGPVREVHGKLFQLALVVDDKETVWMVAFGMRRELGEWKIEGISADRADPPKPASQE